MCRVSSTWSARFIGWFESDKAELFQPHNFPVWIVQDELLGGAWYGFPAYDHPGMKLGKFNHLQGTTNPNMLERKIFPADEQVRGLRSLS